MNLTDFHAKYFAHELTKRCASDCVEKLAMVLADAQVDLNPHQVEAALDEAQARHRQSLLEETTTLNGRWFDSEMDKLDRWAEDRRASLKGELAELDDALKEAKKAAHLAPTLPEKLERQRAARTLDAKREDAWRAYDQASREIDRQKDALLDEISRRLEQRIDQEPLFVLRWHLA
jgi:hypothetical protein